MRRVKPVVPKRMVPLTNEQRDFLGQWLLKYPEPGKVLARRFRSLYFAARNTMSVEEIHSACLEGCVRAVAKFDPAHSLFETFAAHDMRAAVQAELRRWKKLENSGVKVLEDELTDDGFRRSDAVAEVKPDELEAAEHVRVLQAEVTQVVTKRLLKREQLVVALCFGVDGVHRTRGEVGRLLGITGCRVRQLYERSMQRLRSELEVVYRERMKS